MSTGSLAILALGYVAFLTLFVWPHRVTLRCVTCGGIGPLDSTGHCAKCISDAGGWK